MLDIYVSMDTAGLSYLLIYIFLQLECIDFKLFISEF